VRINHMKTCHKCGRDKTEDEFQKRTDTGKLRNDCRECRSADNLRRYHTKTSTREATARASYKYVLKKRYGITLDQYCAIHEAQRGRCAICGTESCATGKRLAVDHCHKTGKIRGLLCQACNTAIGKLKDDPDLIRRAASYVETNADWSDSNETGL
jgi:hypothetical protein